MLYKDFAPTGFDCKGLALDDRQDWIVVPCTQNRDSEALDQSNFAAALKILGGESKTVEVHRFGHWARGWFEIIICHPSLDNQVEEIKRRLENYPVLDEEDFCDREYEERLESIEQDGKRFVNDSAPKLWAAEIYSDLDDPHDADEEDIKSALFDRDWLDEDYVYVVSRDGERMYTFLYEDDAIGRAELLWHKGLGERSVVVVKDGEVIHRGGDMQNPAPMQEV